MHFEKKIEKVPRTVQIFLPAKISVFKVIGLNSADDVGGRFWNAIAVVASASLFTGFPRLSCSTTVFFLPLAVCCQVKCMLPCFAVEEKALALDWLELNLVL